MVSRRDPMPCQIADPQRGPFAPTGEETHDPFRPGKTREDRMPVASRPRVEAHRKRSAA